MLSDLCVTMLVVGHNYVARLRGGDTCFAVVLSRQVALPILLVLANVLDAEREPVVDEQRLAPLTQHELQLAVKPLGARSHCVNGGGIETTWTKFIG